MQLVQVINLVEVDTLICSWSLCYWYFTTISPYAWPECHVKLLHLLPQEYILVTRNKKLGKVKIEKCDPYAEDNRTEHDTNYYLTHNREFPSPCRHMCCLVLVFSGGCAMKIVRNIGMLCFFFFFWFCTLCLLHILTCLLVYFTLLTR